VALAEFNEQAKSQKRPIEAGRVIDGLGGLMRNWRTEGLSECFFFLLLISHLTRFQDRYDRDASRYHQGVYNRKRTDLLAALDSTLSPLFLGQLKNLHKSCLVAFKKEMLDGMRGVEYSFADVVSKAREQCEGRFSEGAKEALVEGTDWSWEDELELLKEEVGSVADQCRRDETKKMVNLIEVRCGSLRG
jgi:Root hair defective 3 GTP-binding protein (RHD3).